MPTYRIDGPGLELPRVVAATLPAQAVAHVVNDSFTARRIEVDEAFELFEQGVRLERAGVTAPLPLQLAEETQEPAMTNGGDPGAALESQDEIEQQDADLIDGEGDGAEYEDDEIGGALGEPQFYGEKPAAPFDAGDEELEGN